MQFNSITPSLRQPASSQSIGVASTNTAHIARGAASTPPVLESSRSSKRTADVVRSSSSIHAPTLFPPPTDQSTADLTSHISSLLALSFPWLKVNLTPATSASHPSSQQSSPKRPSPPPTPEMPETAAATQNEPELSEGVVVDQVDDDDDDADDDVDGSRNEAAVAPEQSCCRQRHDEMEESDVGKSSPSSTVCLACPVDDSITDLNNNDVASGKVYKRHVNLY